MVHGMEALGVTCSWTFEAMLQSGSTVQEVEFWLERFKYVLDKCWLVSKE